MEENVTKFMAYMEISTRSEDRAIVVESMYKTLLELNDSLNNVLILPPEVTEELRIYISDVERYWDNARRSLAELTGSLSQLGIEARNEAALLYRKLRDQEVAKSDERED